MESLYDRLGGDALLDRALERFYQRVLADPLLGYFFDGVDLAQQRFHQKLFLRFALGGGGDYTGVGLGQAHRRLVDELGLNQVHFNAFIGHLEAVLIELEVEPEAVAAVLTRLESVRDELLGLAPQPMIRS